MPFHAMPLCLTEKKTLITNRNSVQRTVILIEAYLKFRQHAV